MASALITTRRRINSSQEDNLVPPKLDTVQLEGGRSTKTTLTISKVFSIIFFRVIFPSFLAFPFFTRVNLFSFIYIIFFLLHPFIPSPGRPVLPKSTKVYLASLLLLSVTLIVAQTSYIIAIHTLDDFRARLQCGSKTETILRQIGLGNIYKADWFYFFLVLGPEVTISVAVVTCFLFQSIFREKVNTDDDSGLVNGHEIILTEKQEKDELGRIKFRETFYQLQNCIILVAIIVTSCYHPSVFSALYLLGYLTLGLVWALHMDFRKILEQTSLVFAVISGLHFVAHYVFSFQLVIDSLDDSSLNPNTTNLVLRLFGLNSRINYTCNGQLSFDSLAVVNLHDGIDFNETFQSCGVFVLILYNLMADRYNFHRLLVKYKVKRPKSIRFVYIMAQMQKKLKRGSLAEKVLVKWHILPSLNALLDQIDKNSYLVSVVIMILWSVFCHGFIALVLLFIAIYLWIKPNSRGITYKLSPFLCFYCSLYLIVQLIFNFDFLPCEFVCDELKVGPVTILLQDIKLKSSKYPTIFYLGLQCLFIISFWKNLFILQDTEQLKKKNEESKETEEELRGKGRARSRTHSRRGTLAALGMTFLVKKKEIIELASVVWMSFCILVLILICTVGEINYINVGYMVFFLIFSGFTVFYLRFKEKRPSFRLFLLCLIYYSMFVLLVVYFINFSFIQNLNFVSHNLRTRGVQSGFQTVYPIALLLIAIKIQFDCFMEPFEMFMTGLAEGSLGQNETVRRLDENKGEEDSAKSAETETSDPLADRIVKFSTQLKEFCWLLLAIHMDKITLLALMGAIVNELTAMNFVLLIGFVCLCLFPRKLQKIGQNIMLVMCSVIIVVKMLGKSAPDQDNFAETLFLCCNCSSVTGAYFPWTRHVNKWMGMAITTTRALNVLWPYLLVVLMSLIHALIDFRMRYRLKKLDSKASFAESRRCEKLRKKYQTKFETLTYCLANRVLFPKVTRQNADQGFLNMFLFLVNYGFYKFSVEILALYVVMMIESTLDFYSAGFMIFLVPIITCRRKRVRIFTKLFAFYVVLVLFLKYASLLWLFPHDKLCHADYLDWLQTTPNNLSLHSLALKMFFFLYDFRTSDISEEFYSLTTSALVFDFILLIVLRSLLKNLKAETVNAELREFGGNNEDGLDEPNMTEEECYFKRVKHRSSRINYSMSNFVTEQKNVLNVVKKVVFMHGIWFTYFMICLCGLNRQDLLGAPFIIIAVYLLWLGQDIALKTRLKMFAKANYIIWMTSFISIVCILLQVPAFFCATHESLDSALSRFFDLRALHRYYITVPGSTNQNSCDQFFSNASLIEWEVTCLMVALIQRRIFMSHYYDFVICEVIITRELSELGGRIIEAINRNDIKEASKYRQKLTADLRAQIDAIRSRGVRSGDWYEPVDHLDAIFNGSRFFDVSKEGKNSPQLSLYEDQSEVMDDEVDTLDQNNIRKISLASTELITKPPGHQWEVYMETIRKRTLDRIFAPTSSENITNENIQTANASDYDKNILAKDANDKNHVGSLIEKELSTKAVMNNDTFTSGDVGSIEESSERKDEMSIETSGNPVETEKNDEKVECKQDNDDDIDYEDNEQAIAPWEDVKVINKTISGADKVISLMTFVVFKMLSEIGVVFDLASSAFHRVIIQLNHNRTIRTASISRYSDHSVEIDLSHELPTPRSSLKPESSNSTNKQEYNIYVLFLRDFWLSFYHFVTAQTDHICYFFIGLVVVLTGNVFDMLLAITCLTWGLLSKPRPTKRFWKFTIFYTALSLLIKWFFRTSLFSFNGKTTNEFGVVEESGVPTWLKMFVGEVDSGTSYSYAVLLLTALCFHRNILLSFGLWTSYSKNRIEQSVYEQESQASATLKTNSLKQTEDYEAAPYAVRSPVVAINPQYHEASPDIEMNEISVKSKDQDVNREKLSVDTGSSRKSFGSQTRAWAFDLKEEFSYFASQIFDSSKTATRDVYVPMIVFDMIGYLIVPIGYGGFSESGKSRSVIQSLLDNEVPFYFLMIILGMFCYTMIDRLAYLTKNVKIKFVTFLSQVVLVHLWLVLINPSINGKPFSKNSSAIMFYLVRWVYWILSAYQIKCSFPVRVLGNFFSRKYNNICKFSMIIFASAPFVFELRVFMDWVFTPTTLKFARWLEVEDAFVKTFIIKCTRVGEQKDQRQRGELQKAFPSKFIYLMILIGCIFIIWAPLLLFAFISDVTADARLRYSSMSLRIGNYEPLFLSNGYTESVNFNTALTQASSFGYDTTSITEKSYDCTSVVFDPDAQQIWAVTPPAKRELETDLLKCEDVQFVLHVSFTRECPNDECTITKPVANIEVLTVLEKETCEQFLRILSNKTDEELQKVTTIVNSEDTSVTLSNAVPTFYYIENEGKSDYLPSLGSDERDNWKDLEMSKESESNECCSNFIQWWVIKTSNQGPFQYDSSGIRITVFHEKVVASALSQIASYGIIGLYITFVILFASKLKSLFSNYSDKIITSEVPDVSLIQKIILEMYMCREMKDFILEEDLYSQLQYLYRSPETMIQNTKYKED